MRATGHTDLRDVLDLIVTAEYGHMLAATGSLLSTCELLLTDRQKFTMEMDLACQLQPLLTESPVDDLRWLTDLKQQSLIAADCLHRRAIREPQKHSEAALQRATAAIDSNYQQARAAYQSVGSAALAT